MAECMFRCVKSDKGSGFTEDNLYPILSSGETIDDEFNAREVFKGSDGLYTTLDKADSWFKVIIPEINIEFEVKCIVGYKGYHISEGFYLSFTKDKCYKVKNGYIYDDLDNGIYVGTQAKCAKDLKFSFLKHHNISSIGFEDVDVDVDLKWNTDMIPVFKRVDYFDKENVGPTPRRSGRSPWVEEFIIDEDYETYYVDGIPYNIHTGSTLNKLSTAIPYGRYRQYRRFNLSKEEKDYIAEDTRHMMELFETKCKKMYFGVRGVPEIKEVIYHDPATIIYWADGTRTIVKCQEGDTFDPEKGLTMAICKKLYGDKGNYYNKLKKWLPEEKKEDIETPIFLSKRLVTHKDGDKIKKPTIDDLRDMFREVVGEKECYGGIDKKCD